MMNRKKFTLDSLESPENAIRLRWNLRPSSLLETLSETDLPFIVQAENGRKWSPYADKSFDWTQPLLLYRQISGVKVYAQVIDQQNGVKEAADDQVSLNGSQLFVIPIECQEWFELLGQRLQDGNSFCSNSYLHTGSRCEGSSGSWNTLAKVIAAMPVRFLSLHSLKVFALVSEASEEPCYDKTTMPPYSEFQVVGLLEDLVTYTKNRQTESKVMRCLECRDNDARNVLIPAETHGRFFATELKKGGRARQCRSLPKASKLRKLVTEEELPVYVRILSAPQNEYPLSSNIVELYEINTENTIIGCNVSSEGNTMFELPASAEMLFHRAPESVTCSKNPYVRKALTFAKEKIDSFQKSIKARSALQNNSPKFIHIVETPM